MKLLSIDQFSIPKIVDGKYKINFNGDPILGLHKDFYKGKTKKEAAELLAKFIDYAFQRRREEIALQLLEEMPCIYKDLLEDK